ncbi:hypothetical protein C8R44DRAFT_752403 [Mycena epipterygia]|nr:hypothetical protein C8R44DRAFT_752403 [Mycena epipterygia]
MGRRCKMVNKTAVNSSQALITPVPKPVPLPLSEPLNAPELLSMPVLGHTPVQDAAFPKHPLSLHASELKTMAVSSDLVPCAGCPSSPARCDAKHCVWEVVYAAAKGENMKDMSSLLPNTPLCPEYEIMTIASQLVPCARCPPLPVHCYAKHCVREVVDAVPMGKDANDTSILVRGTLLRKDGAAAEYPSLEVLHDTLLEEFLAEGLTCCKEAELGGVMCGAHPLCSRCPQDVLDLSYTSQDYAALFPDTDTLVCDVSTSSLLESYRDECKLDAAKDPSGLVADNDPITDSAQAKVTPPEGALKVNKHFCKDTDDKDSRWIQKGELVMPNEMWLPGGGARHSKFSSISTKCSPPNKSTQTEHHSRRRPHARGSTSVPRGGRFCKVLPNGEANPVHLAQGLQCLMARSNTVVSSTFSLLQHASHSKSGFQGTPPPLRARDKIRDLFFELPGGRALFPYLKHFFPVEYHHNPEKHPDRGKNFMKQPIIKRVMGWIANVMRLIFPGITEQMDCDSDWHCIKPPFADYFWNLCLNALFEGQRSISTPPHADSKDQVLVCVMLVYVLKSGVRFNDTQRIWLWLWEADTVIQLPAWTLAAYPSALFFHFNLDAHDVKFVTTEGDERPTRENSRPIELGDGDGRGSLVFFNQSTMRTGPVTGDKQAKWSAMKFFNFTSAVYLLAKETAIYISLPNAS